MAISKGSSGPGTTSKPTELDLLRALAHVPAWADEPLASLVAEELHAPPSVVRALLDRMDIALDVPGALVGVLDETWLLRTRGAQSAPPLEGVVAWTQLEDSYAIVRTFAEGAVARERHLRALHAHVGERPLAELHRAPGVKPARALTRADWALLRAMRATPFASVQVLAEQAVVPLRAAKERVPKLAAELRLRAWPRDIALAHVIARLAPSSSAAARHAFAAFAPALVTSHVPDEGETSRADCVILGPPDAWPALRAAACDVPGVASVDVVAVTRAWHDEAALDAALARAQARALR